MMELLVVNNFCKKAPSKIFDWVLNISLRQRLDMVVLALYVK